MVTEVCSSKANWLALFAKTEVADILHQTPFFAPIYCPLPPKFTNDSQQKLQALYTQIKTPKNQLLLGKRLLILPKNGARTGKLFHFPLNYHVLAIAILLWFK